MFRSLSRFRFGSRSRVLGVTLAAAALLVVGCSSPGAALDSVSLAASSHVAGRSSTWTYTAKVAQDDVLIFPVALTGPAGTVFPSDPNDYMLTDAMNGGQVPLDVMSWGDSAALLVGCDALNELFDEELFGNHCPPKGDVLTLTVSGVQNPSVGTYPGSDFTLYMDCADEGTPPRMSAPSPAPIFAPDCALPTPNGLTFMAPAPPLSFQGITTAVTDGQLPQTVTSPEASVGSFVFDVLQAQGGVAPYNWSLESGTLPPGLKLYASGALMGVPTTAGTYTFTVQVMDDQSTHYDEEITFVVQ